LTSPLGETVIGLVVIWFLVASLASGIVELIASALGFRAKHLWRVLGRALDTTQSELGPAVVEAAHLSTKPPNPSVLLAKFLTLVPSGGANATKRIRNIDPRVAATALVGVVNEPEFDDTQLGKLVAGLPSDVRQAPDKLREWIEHWFDGLAQSMQAGYRRRIRWWAGLVAVFVVGVGGIDSLGLASRLYHDPIERALLVTEAERVVAPPESTTTVVGQQPPASTPTTIACPPPAAGEGSTTKTESTTTTDYVTGLGDRLRCVQDAASAVRVLRVSVWQDWHSHRPTTFVAWVRLIAGLLASWAAVLFGATFWFSVLKRLMGLRSAGTSGSQG
jgi:hypothetical protein